MNFLIIFLLLIYLVLVFWRPHWGVFIILFALPAYQLRFSVAGIPSTFLEWLILLLALATIVKMFQPASKHLKRLRIFLKSSSWLIICVGGVLIASLIAALVSPELLKGLGIFKAYFAEGLLFFVLCVIHLDTQKKLGQAIKSLGLMTICLALFGVYQFFTLYRLPPAWWGPGLEPRRVVSFYTYPNAVSLLTAPILSLFTALWVFKSSLSGHGEGEAGNGLLSRKFTATVVASGVVLLILTFSRGAWIGYIASIIFLLLFTRHRKNILLLLVAGIMALVILPVSRARILPVLEGRDPAGQERFKLWKAAWEIIKANPLLGGGLMGFRDWYGALKQSNADNILNYPHNFFLNFWVETGLLGLTAVIGALIWTGKRARELYRKHITSRPLVIATLSAWVALLVHGQFDAPFFKNDLAVLFWFLLAVIPIISLWKQPEIKS